MGDTEVLELTHFVKPPILSLKTLIGKTAIAKLCLRNPDDDAKAEVTVIKFPESSIRDKGTFELLSPGYEFVVDEGSAVELQISWTPDEVAKSREVIQFSVVKSTGATLRLQAFLIAESIAPKPSKSSSSGETSKYEAAGKRDRTDQTFVFKTGKEAQEFVERGISDSEVGGVPSPRRGTYTKTRKETRFTEVTTTSTSVKVISPTKKESNSSVAIHLGSANTGQYGTWQTRPVIESDGTDSSLIIEESESVTRRCEQMTYEEEEVADRLQDLQLSDRKETTTQFQSPKGLPVKSGRRIRFNDVPDIQVNDDGVFNSTVCPDQGLNAVEVLREEDLGSAIKGVVHGKGSRVIETPCITPVGGSEKRRKMRRSMSLQEIATDAAEQNAESPPSPRRSLSRELEDIQPSPCKKDDSANITRSISLRTLYTAPSQTFDGAHEKDSRTQLIRAFTAWINDVLRSGSYEWDEGDASHDPFNKAAAERLLKAMKGAGAGVKEDPVPSIESNTFRRYADTKNLEKLRNQAENLYNSEDLVWIRSKIREAIHNGRLCPDPKQSILHDIGLRVEIVQLLSSVNPVWLRVGLEVVFGEALVLNSPKDRMGLLHFSVDRLLGDPLIQLKHAHVTIKSITGDRGSEEIGKMFLDRFLDLWIFLDTAKKEKLIAGDPCLFAKKQQKYKSVEGMMEFVSRLTGPETYLKRILNRAGFDPSRGYIQMALDEYPFSVSRLQIDLRNGIILTRVAEILRGVHLARDQRPLCPATSRVQKITNMESVLFSRLLTPDGVDLSGVEPRNIVNGHAEQTLLLIWRMVIHYGIKQGVDCKLLSDEISRLEQQAAILEMGLPLPPKGDTEEEIEIRLLFRWVQVVSHLKGVQVQSWVHLGVSGLCALLRYYQPHLLPCSTPKLGWDSGDRMREFLRGVSQLGGVPSLIEADSIPRGSGWHCDIDRRIKILFLALLSSRLLESARETFAVLRIQHFWRRIQIIQRFRSVVTEALSLYRKQVAAATRIQAEWRSFRRRERFRQAAIVLQAAYRRKVVRTEYRKLRSAAVKIQAVWRSYLARKRFLQIKTAASRIQVAFRIWNQKRLLLKGVIAIQSAIRGYLVRKEHKRQVTAAVEIQSRWRAWKARRAFAQKRLAALLIQKRWKQELSRRNFIKSIVKIQSHVRGQLIRKRLTAKKSGAVRIQAWWRMRRAQRNYLRIREAERRKKLDMEERARVAAEREKQKSAVGKLERAVSCWLFCRRLQKAGEKRRNRRHEAATTIQKHVRGFLTRKLKLLPPRRAEAVVRVESGRPVESGRTIAHRRTRGHTLLRSYLRGVKSLESLEEALEHIQFVVCHVRAERKKFAAKGLITAVFQMLGEANRSFHYLRVVQRGVDILAILSQEPELAREISQTKDCRRLLIHTMEVSRKEWKEIYCHCVHILLILTFQCPDFRQQWTIDKISMKKIETMKAECTRKMKMESDRAASRLGQKGQVSEVRKAERGVQSLLKLMKRGRWNASAFAHSSQYQFISALVATIDSGAS